MFRPIRIKNYVTAMESLGFGRTAVLAGSEIQFDKLADPDYLVNMDQTNTVIANILRLSKDRGAGFDMGMHAELTELGIVAYAMISSRTVRDALGLWINYSNSLLGALSTIRPIESDPGEFVVEVSETVPTAGGIRFCAEEFIAITRKLGGTLAHEAPVFRFGELAYPKPAYMERYSEFFKGPVTFNASKTRLALDQQWVSKPLVTSDLEFHDICVKHCSHIMKQIAASSPLLSQIRAMLLRSGSAFPSLDEVASRLGISPRTLRRKLLEEGTSFQEVILAFKMDLAKQYATQSTMTNKEISYLLGYASVNAFTHMFQSQTGYTLGQYRKRMTDTSE